MATTRSSGGYSRSSACCCRLQRRACTAVPLYSNVHMIYIHTTKHIRESTWSPVVFSKMVTKQLLCSFGLRQAQAPLRYCCCVATRHVGGITYADHQRGPTTPAQSADRKLLRKKAKIIYRPNIIFVIKCVHINLLDPCLERDTTDSSSSSSDGVQENKNKS